MKHIKRSSFLSRGGGSGWYDPERIGQYTLMCVLYFAGLLAFQKFTGLLDPPQSKLALSPPPGVVLHTAEDARSFLRAFDGDLESSRTKRSHLFRHLLANEEGNDEVDKKDEEAGSSNQGGNSRHFLLWGTFLGDFF